MKWSPKEKKCKSCGTPFMQERPGQVCCDWSCAVAHHRAKQEAARARLERREALDRRKVTKAKLEALETVSDWIKKAQTACNRWIRARDAGQPCISCGKYPHETTSSRYETAQFHAGHYRSTKAAPELRFHPDNIFLQCSTCNVQLSGNLIEYRKGLLQRIGPERLEWIEGPHTPQRYRIEDLKPMIEEWKRQTKELESQRLEAA